MEEYKELYNELNNEFRKYQVFAEERLQNLSRVNKELERKLSIFVNIVEVSKYINSYISDANLLAMINDMIVGVLGVNYSTIHLIENDVLVPKVTNVGCLSDTKIHYELIELETKKSFIKNSSAGIFKENGERRTINSLVAVPIYIKEKLIGYIIVEHIYYTFFQNEDVKFVNYIAHQVAVAIENSILYKKVQDLAEKDSLLNIYNRRYFYNIADRTLTANKNEFFALVMTDIDDFKLVNDTYGHQVGDRALKDIVRIVNENLGEEDILARYGGEELIILIRSANDKDAVVKLIEKIRSEIESNIIKVEEEKSFSLTMSFGISFPMEIDNNKLFIEKIIKNADDKLYKAKRTGKNKIEY